MPFRVPELREQARFGAAIAAIFGGDFLVGRPKLRLGGVTVVATPGLDDVRARLRARAGDLAGALQQSRDAIDYSYRVSDLSNALFALNDAVHTLATLHEHVTAAEIFGAMGGGALRALTYQWVGTEAARRDSARQSAKDALGDVEFQAAWSRGAAMTMDEVASVVIAKLDELLASLDEGRMA